MARPPVRWARSLSLFVVLGCRPADPLATAGSLHAAPPPVRTASVGDTIALHQHQVRIVGTVADSGSLEIPMCGAVTIAGRDAAAVCAAAAQCLAQVYRSAALYVTVGDDSDPTQSSAGCNVMGEPRPTGWGTTSQRVMDALSRVNTVDPMLLVRAVKAASELEALRVEYTRVHPEVGTARERVARLLTATDGSTGQPDGASLVRARVRTLAADATADRDHLGVQYGEQHPQVLRAQARAQLIAAMEAALAVRAMAGRPWDRLVSEAEARAWQSVADHPPPTRANLDSPPAQVRIDGTWCTELRNAFEVRIAYLVGRAELTDDTGQLDAVIDALVVARARFASAAPCGPKPLGGVRTAPARPPG